VMTYLSACLGTKAPITSEPELMDRLVRARGTIANQAPTSQVVPKKEQTLEFNLIHKALSAAWAELGLHEAIDSVDLPVNVRMVYGTSDPKRANVPFSSAKLHSDVWAGVPADAIVVVMPLLGDIDDITIEIGEMAPELELAWMRPLTDFDAGREVPYAVRYDDVKLKHGHIYFADARTLHQTVKRKPGGVRVSIDFRFRLAGNEAYRNIATKLYGEPRFDESVSYSKWLKVGTHSMMAFDETMDACRRATVPPREYGADYRALEMFRA